jgi:hypothetical protein
MVEDMLSPFMKPVPNHIRDNLIDSSSELKCIPLADGFLKAASVYRMKIIERNFSPTIFTKKMFSAMIGLHQMADLPSIGCPVCSPLSSDMESERIGPCGEFFI